MPTAPDDFSLIRVVVIDDQSHVRQFVRTVLKTMGITDVTDTAGMPADVQGLRMLGTSPTRAISR